MEKVLQMPSAKWNGSAPGRMRPICFRRNPDRKLIVLIVRGPEVPEQRLCRGPIISREQYLIDIEQWGYSDARLPPHGNMQPEEIALWTKAIKQPD